MSARSVTPSRVFIATPFSVTICIGGVATIAALWLKAQTGSSAKTSRQKLFLIGGRLLYGYTGCGETLFQNVLYQGHGFSRANKAK
jgi:hypothetical protein